MPVGSIFNRSRTSESVRDLAADLLDLTGEVHVRKYVTSGAGTPSDPFLGWDTTCPWVAWKDHVFSNHTYGTPIGELPWNKTGMLVRGIRATVIKYTGTEVIDEVVNCDVNDVQSGQSCYHARIENMWIDGGGLAKHGITQTALHRSEFPGVNVVNTTDTGINALGPSYCVYDNPKLTAQGVSGLIPNIKVMPKVGVLVGLNPVGGWLSSQLWFKNAQISTSLNIDALDSFNKTNATFATDLAATSATGNSPVVTSASYTFVAGDVGAWLFIKPSGSWPTTSSYNRWHQIASVAAGAATLKAAVGEAIVDSGYYEPNAVAGASTTASPTGGVWGIDYTRQAAAQVTYTDLVIVTPGTKATSAAHPFGKNHVGNMVEFPVGQTGVAVRKAIILSISGTTVTFDRTIGTTGTTGVSATLGGQGFTYSRGIKIVGGHNIHFDNGDAEVCGSNLQVDSGSINFLATNLDLEASNTTVTLSGGRSTLLNCNIQSMVTIGASASGNMLTSCWTSSIVNGSDNLIMFNNRNDGTITGAGTRLVLSTSLIETNGTGDINTKLYAGVGGVLYLDTGSGGRIEAVKNVMFDEEVRVNKYMNFQSYSGTDALYVADNDVALSVHSKDVILSFQDGATKRSKYLYMADATTLLFQHSTSKP